jgi:hypothetical protein
MLREARKTAPFAIGLPNVRYPGEGQSLRRFIPFAVFPSSRSVNFVRKKPELAMVAEVEPLLSLAIVPFEPPLSRDLDDEERI